MNAYMLFGKRAFDVCCALPGLVVLSPVIIIISCFIKLSDKGPLFFSQDRVGKGFRTFRLFKFRTMVVNADKIGEAVTRGKDPRITKIGKFLRRYKLDELPQLFNVLKGDMSIVGPRPEVEKYVVLFKKPYEHILTIKPGITDYAALEYRDEEEVLNKYEDTNEGYITEVLPAKIVLYEKYLREMSFTTDLKIIMQTLWRIIA